MTDARKQAIIADLQAVVSAFVPKPTEPTLSMFGLISRYNATGKNVELIGGDWATTNGFNMPA